MPRRPFSIFQVSGDTLSILYKTVGQGTVVLSQMRPGEELNMIGPLGHGFTVPPVAGEIPLLVAGGYGMAASDHLYRDTGTAARGDGFGRLWPWRVDHAYCAQPPR